VIVYLKSFIFIASSKNFNKKTLLFEAEIYVSGYAPNTGFCTIYPRAYGGLVRNSQKYLVVIWTT
jgi:hypothetical protein